METGFASCYRWTVAILKYLLWLQDFVAVQDVNTAVRVFFQLRICTCWTAQWLRHNWHGLTQTERMIEFFFPILEHFCPFFIQIAQMGLISPRWGLILPRIPPPTSVLTLQSQTPFTQNNPNRAKPTPKHPFSWPEHENGQNELPSRQPGSNWANVWKVDKTFLEVGKKQNSYWTELADWQQMTSLEKQI